LFRIVAIVILPLAVLTVIELALRLAGYGYDTGFFKPLRINGQDYLVENDRFGFRFFPPDIARAPATFRFAAHKPPGTYRIFILGESAALGDPEPAFGAGRYLEVLLREKFPNSKFEVVNVAMTAINSHAILPIARDCARQNGDLWILYLGNNEMVGPFGAATVFGAQAPPWPLVRLNLAIQKLRLGQLLVDATRKLRSTAHSPAPWNGMQMFVGNLVPPGDPRKEVVYRDFQRNLHDILRAGEDSGAHILLSTMAVNLQDCPPFASVVDRRLGAGGSNQVVQLLGQGNALAQSGDYAGAAKCYDAAAQLQPQSADLAYQWGECMRISKNPAAARQHYQEAVDWDCLPFRADTRINGIISQAGRQNTSKLTLLDADQAIARTTNAILGDESFYEHVHLNFDGNYRLALAWANHAAARLPPPLATGARRAWLTQADCERRLALTEWDRYQVLTEVCRRLQQPPLKSQSNTPGRLQKFEAAAAALHQAMDAAAAQRARDLYWAALKEAPQDGCLHENFAMFLAEQNDLAAASEQWQAVQSLFPQDYSADYELGRLAGQMGRHDEAQSRLRKALAARPSFAPAWFELGNAQAAAGNYDGAVHAFAQALKYEPRDARCWFASGLALAMLNRPGEAIEHYRQAVTFAPDDWQAHFELGGLLGQVGKMAEAREESAAAVRLRPDFPRAHLNLGLALVQLGQLDEAEQQFTETLRLEPTNSKAADYLDQTRALKKGKP
jgi:tetratricopeptide (TPR) repeat protein